MHRLGADVTEEFDSSDDEGAEDDDEPVAMALAPEPGGVYAENRSYPVTWQSAARSDAGDYYGAVCEYASEICRSLQQRGTARDWALLRPGGRFSRLMALLDDTEYPSCDDLVDAWAPNAIEEEPHPPPAPRDYGPRPDERMTFVSALMTEIHYFLGQTEDHTELSPIGTAKQLVQRVTGRERGRVAFVTGLIYGGGGGSVAEAEELARQSVASVLRDVIRALGLKGRTTEDDVGDPFLDDLRVAVVGAPGIIRFGIRGEMTAVQAVGYVQWSGEVTLKGATLRSERILSLLNGSRYAYRGFSDYLLAESVSGRPRGADFFDRMTAEIAGYFRDVVRNSSYEITVRELRASYAEHGPGQFYRDSDLKRIWQADLASAPDPEERLTVFSPLWVWLSWNYPLYSRTEADLAWFMRPSPSQNEVPRKGAKFKGLLAFFRDFYSPTLNGGEPSGVAAQRARDEFKALGVEWTSEVYRSLENVRVARAFGTRYVDGSDTIAYGASAFPGFVLTAERVALVRSWLATL